MWPGFTDYVHANAIIVFLICCGVFFVAVIIFFFKKVLKFNQCLF
jgi:hypothetical protein